MRQFIYVRERTESIDITCRLSVCPASTHLRRTGILVLRRVCVRVHASKRRTPLPSDRMTSKALINLAPVSSFFVFCQSKIEALVSLYEQAPWAAVFSCIHE